MMDLSIRASGSSPETPSRVENIRRRPSTSTSAVSTSVVPGKGYSTEVGAALSNSQQVNDGAKDDIFGQFTFAPATQTTVVTTTTTTTTSFPPLMIKAPHHLHELDPKLYPLASSPTPKSIKRFCFDIGGKPTYFNEAENTSHALHGVRHTYFFARAPLLTCFLPAEKPAGSPQKVGRFHPLGVKF